LVQRPGWHRGGPGIQGRGPGFACRWPSARPPTSRPLPGSVPRRLDVITPTSPINPSDDASAVFSAGQAAQSDRIAAAASAGCAGHGLPRVTVHTVLVAAQGARRTCESHVRVPLQPGDDFSSVSQYGRLDLVGQNSAEKSSRQIGLKVDGSATIVQLSVSGCTSRGVRILIDQYSK
jgi:hypothetical protein